MERRRHRRGGRAEIEIDRGFALPRRPELGFAAAVREPLVKLHRPTFEFETWDWAYFAWPHDRPDANLEMRDSDPKATFEADRVASEGFLNRNTWQLEKVEMDRYMQVTKQEQEQEKEDNLFIKQEPLPWACRIQPSPGPGAWHCNAMQGPSAYSSLTV